MVMIDPSPRNYSVRFAADLCLYHEGAVLDTEYVRDEDVWYRMDELKSMKSHALRVSRDINSIRVASRLSSTYGRSNSDTLEAIIAWVSSCESLRGLERFANADFGEKRTNARRRVIQVVLTAQHKMRTDGEKDKYYVERVLSRLSEAFSQDYTRFAAIMGQADMLVVSPIDHKCSVNEGDCTYSEKIIPTKIIFADMASKKEIGIRFKKETSISNANRSPFCHRIKKNLSNAQRDFIEMRFCF